MLVAGVAKVSVRCRFVFTSLKKVAPNDAIGELRGEVIEVDLRSNGGGGG